jgi:hypothetical protein
MRLPVPRKLGQWSWENETRVSAQLRTRRETQHTVTTDAVWCQSKVTRPRL